MKTGSSSSLPFTGNFIQSAAGNFNSNIASTPSIYSQELLEIQSNMLALHQLLQTSFANLNNQISVGLGRVGKLIEVSNRGGFGNMADSVIQSSTSGSGSFGEHGKAPAQNQTLLLQRIAERPSIALTGRKVDIETPADSIRSSMAAVFSNNGSSAVLSSNIQSPPAGSLLSIPLQPLQPLDRYQYHDPFKQAVLSEGQGGLVVPPSVLITEQASSIQPSQSIPQKVNTSRLNRNSSVVKSAMIKSQASIQSHRSTGIKWEAPDTSHSPSKSQSTAPSPIMQRAGAANFDSNQQQSGSPGLKTLNQLDLDSPNKSSTSSSVFLDWVNRITGKPNDDSQSDFQLPQPVSEVASLERFTAHSSYAIHKSTGQFQARKKSLPQDRLLNNGPLANSGHSENALRTQKAPSIHENPSKQHRQSFGESRQSNGSRLSIGHRQSMQIADGQKMSPLINVHSVDQENTSAMELPILFRNETRSATDEMLPRVASGTQQDSLYPQQLRSPQIFDKEEVYAFDDRDKDKESLKPSIESSIYVEVKARVKANSVPVTHVQNTAKSLPSATLKQARKKTRLETIFFGAVFEDEEYERIDSTEVLAQQGFFTTGIHPDSAFASVFNLVIIFVYISALFYLPYRAAFHDNGNENLIIFSWSLSGFFMLESIVSLFTPQNSIKYGRTPSILGDWQRAYVQKYLLIDILSTIPWSEIIQNESIYFPLTVFCFFRTIRLPRMIAKNRLLRPVHTFIENIIGVGNSLSRILSISAFVLIYVHIQACVLYYIGRANGFSGWSQLEHWEVYPGGISAAPLTDRYVWMLSQSIGNVFPLAFQPETNAEQIATFIFVTLGAIIYAVVIGLISSAAISYDAPGKLYRQKIDELMDYVNWKHIDKATKKKLLAYYEFKYRGKYFEETNLLADMNVSLRREVSSINCRRLIEKVPFLKRNSNDGRDDIFIGKIATALVPVFFIPGDYIFNQGERSTEMFFILSGTVNIIVNGAVVASFDDGNFFGEVALIANIPRTASVQAATPCNLYSLSAIDFNEIILEYDDIRQRIDHIYEERMMRVRIEQGIPQQGDYNSPNQSNYSRISNMY